MSDPLTSAIATKVEGAFLLFGTVSKLLVQEACEKDSETCRFLSSVSVNTTLGEHSHSETRFYIVFVFCPTQCKSIFNSSFPHEDTFYRILYNVINH